MGIRLLSMLALVGCHPVSPRAEKIALLDGDAEAGGEVYQEYCVSCHGNNGVGTNRAMHGNDRVNLATASEWYDAPVFITMIVDGVEGTDMEAYGPILEDQEIADVYAHILAFPE